MSGDERQPAGGATPDVLELAEAIAAGRLPRSQAEATIRETTEISWPKNYDAPARLARSGTPRPAAASGAHRQRWRGV